MPNFVQAAGIFSGKPRQPGGANPGKPDLPAMRMSRELEIHGVVSRLVGKVRFVHQQDDQFLAGDSVQSEIQIWFSFPHRSQTAEPNSRPFLLNGNRTVTEHGKTMGIESLDYPRSVRLHIVIAENRYHAETRVQLGEQAGARFGSVGSLFCGVEAAMKYRNRDEVAGQDDQVRMQVVHDFYRGSEWHRGEMLVVVKVTEVRYGEAVESSGQRGEHDFHRGEDGAVRLKNCGVLAQGQRSGRGHPGAGLEEPPSG